MSGSLDPAYFEALYAADPDPWQFQTSDYERAKYAATLAALPAARFARGLEVGCSIGVLTELLAGRCDALLSLDVAEAALSQARARCAALPHVAFMRMRTPGEWPAGTFDLIMFSEVLYYLDGADLAAMGERVVEGLAPGGSVMLVHWLGPTCYPTSGDAAVAAFAARCSARLSFRHQSRTAEYRLDLLG